MRIGLLGYGVVGKGVYDEASKFHKVVKVLRRHKEGELFTDDINEVIKEKPDVIVECLTNTPVAYEYIKMALEAGIRVVSSNKAIVASHYDELLKLAKDNKTNISFEAAVAGGIPWLHALCDLKHNDKINSLKGIMNGTTNYILSKIFDEELSYDECLRKAIELGYAEADYSSDVDGIDVKYKTCLSGNVAFNASISLDDIPAYGIRYLDDYTLEYARAKDYVIKLLGYCDNANAFVLPFFIKKGSNLATISLNYNCTIVNTEYMNDITLIGQGAGRYPTASAIMLDVLRPLDNLATDNRLNITNDKEMVFYLSSGKGVDQKYIAKLIPSGAVLTKKLPVHKLKDIVKDGIFVGGFYD